LKSRTFSHLLEMICRSAEAASMQGLHTRPRRAWDHRIRESICRTRNPNLYPELGIPRSTAATWLIRDCPEVVTLEPDDDDAVALTEQLQRVEKIVRRLVAIIRLQRALLCVFGISLEKTRLPDGGGKALVLRAVARARAALPLGVALQILDLSPARFHAWTRADNAECGLNDRSSCPRTSPSQLTPEETMTIKEMVTSNEYRHMPL
jgi:putative transposase